jgi:GTP-binding protein HflX
VSESELILHVVDGSHPDPESQINAVHEVFGDIDALKVPEVIVVNKTDAASPETLLRLRSVVPEAVFVSARTGEGLEDLLDILDARLPRPEIDVHVLLPYDRGDLVSRVHGSGEVLTEEHEPTGTVLTARVGSELAAQLAPYAI